MTTPYDDNNGAGNGAPNGDNNGPRPELSWFDKALDVVITPFVFVYMLLREPWRFLEKRVYNGSMGFFWGMTGLVTALGLGILTGYKMRAAEYDWIWWLSGSVLTMIGVFCYAFPASVYLFFDKFAAWSRPLWRRAEEKAQRSLSKVLKAVACASYVLLWIQVKAPFVAWLDKGDWGSALWFIGGGIALLLAIAATIGIGLPVIALASSFVVLYLLADFNSLFVPFIDFAPTIQVALVNLVEWLLWLGFGFPLLVLALHRMFFWVGDYFEYVGKNVYGNPEEDKFHRLFGHLITFVGTAASVFAAWHFAPSFGFDTALTLGLWNLATYGLLVVIGVAAYIYGGRLLLDAGNVIAGLATAAGAGYLALGFVGSFGYGSLICWMAAIFAGLVGLFGIFPAVYLALRAVGGGVADSLTKPLDEMHKALSSEIIQSFDHCYGDRSPFAAFFAQVVNVCVTGLATYAAYKAIGETNVVSCILGCSGAILFTYFIGGKILKHRGNATFAIVSGIALGAVVGVHMYAEQYAIWKSIAGAAAAIAVYCVALFPVAYVLVRAPLVKVFRIDAWAGRFLVWVYSLYEGMVAAVWSRCAVLYVPIKEASKRAYARISASAKASMERIKARFTR